MKRRLSARVQVHCNGGRDSIDVDAAFEDAVVVDAEINVWGACACAAFRVTFPPTSTASTAAAAAMDTGGAPAVGDDGHDALPTVVFDPDVGMLVITDPIVDGAVVAAVEVDVVVGDMIDCRSGLLVVAAVTGVDMVGVVGSSVADGVMWIAGEAETAANVNTVAAMVSDEFENGDNTLAGGGGNWVARRPDHRLGAGLGVERPRSGCC